MLLLLCSILLLFGQSPKSSAPWKGTLVDAHNCYPERGEWRDRIERALKLGYPVGIEQDVAWYGSQAVVSHTDKTTGTEPTLRQHFFERVRPVVEQALRENDRARWPLIVVHFDFKDNQPALLNAVWRLLGEYRDWITTAEKTAAAGRLSPFDLKPLLVLTENADAQEEVFFGKLAPGERMRIFGSANTRAIPSEPKAERERLMATLRPEELLSTPASNYRRWWNLSWHNVELNGQNEAGEWTPAEDRRLRALVDHAHKLGYWIRFYTLDGFTADESQGWNQSYNFGSRAGVAVRWDAAIAAGVDLIASDQYEELARAVRR
jgi:hypothetical protein